MADADDLIRLALAFPGAAQYPHFDRVAFKARVTFATLAPDRLTANIKFSVGRAGAEMRRRAGRLYGAAQRLGRARLDRGASFPR